MRRESRCDSLFRLCVSASVVSFELTKTDEEYCLLCYACSQFSQKEKKVSDSTFLSLTARCVSFINSLRSVEFLIFLWVSNMMKHSYFFAKFFLYDSFQYYPAALNLVFIILCCLYYPVGLVKIELLTQWHFGLKNSNSSLSIGAGRW